MFNICDNISNEHLNLPEVVNNNVIYDDVNLTVHTRSPMIRMMNDNGYDKIYSCFVDTPFITCRSRNEARTAEGKHIPMSEYDRMRNTLTVPTKQEGFDECFVIPNYDVSKPSDLLTDILTQIKKDLKENEN